MKRSLTIGDSSGTFPGMIKERKFIIILVTENKGTGTGIIAKYGNVVT